MTHDVQNDSLSAVAGEAQRVEPGVELHRGERILCARLPLQGVSLLVPYACVAEIVNLSLRSNVGAFLGEVDWRGVRIPVLSLERACGREVEVPRGRVRLVVLYGLRDKESLPYYAIVLDGAPRTESVQAERLEEGQAGDCGLLGSGVRMGGQTYHIPDLEAIELWLEGVRFGRG
ncbi:chemotaxis protein CheW [Thiofaba sp. EF100]|uniref:chemotaxis protein CheW n=1 Tax=Thiofaba sp. EF100 TaxID=3121274 RepID=UPI0032217E9D